MRALLAMLLLPALAYAQSGKVADLKTRTTDLVFKVEDLEAKAREMQAAQGDLEMKETSDEIHMEFAADVLFDFNRAELREEATEALEQAAAILRDKAKGTVYVDGHTDAIGSDNYNQGLSDRRAASVVAYFTNIAGLNTSRFVPRGHGARDPVAPNTLSDGRDDPVGRQKNRRVEIVVKKN